MPRSIPHTANPEAAARLAEQTAAAMFSRDAASRLIGITIASVRPGYSLLTMTVRPDMVNGHHICHGGYLFTPCRLGLRLRLQRLQPEYGRLGLPH
jgi:hypothetical protein